MLQDPLGFLEEVTQQHGNVVGLVLGGQRVVLVADPDTAKDVLIDRAALFCKAREHCCTLTCTLFHPCLSGTLST